MSKILSQEEIDALPHYSKDPDGLCITEHDARFLKNIKPYLKNKVYEIKEDDEPGSCIGNWVKQENGKFKVVKS